MTPSFIGIGAQKAGTTWLDKQLREHPETWFPPMKEVHFFDFVHRPDFRRWINWHLRHTMRRELLKEIKNAETSKKAMNWKKIQYFSSIMNHSQKFTDEWYCNLFSPSKDTQISGEITPEYSSIGIEGIQHVKRLCPDVKVIHIIRDPVSRAWSQLKMNMQRKGKLKNALSEDNEVKNLDLFYEHLKHESILDRGNYRTQVPLWVKNFNHSDLLYIPFGSIKTSPKEVLTTVSNHIGIDSSYEFKNLNKKVFSGSKVSMPLEIREILEEMMKDQYIFIESHFGKDFLSNI